MRGFYKMNPVDWNLGTDELTLEQEAAYLRVCNAIYIAEQSIPNNPRVLSGLFRCSPGKAKRLLKELIDAGKLAIEDSKIVNQRAMNELSTRRQRDVNCAPTARQQQVDDKCTTSSQENPPSKSLKSNNTEKIPPVRARKEQSRAEQKREEPPKPPDHGGGDGIMEMGNRVLELIGISFSDPSWFGDFTSISKWIGDGLDFELDIFPAIQQAVASRRKKAPNFRPRNLNYFDRPVREWHSRRKPDSGLVDHFLAKKDTPQWIAWRNHRLSEGERVQAMDSMESWSVPTEWPPGTHPNQTKH